MSTFSNASASNADPTPSAPSSTIFPAALRDQIRVQDLREDRALALLPRLNRDLGMGMSRPTYHRIQQYYRNVLRRDPSVGELRLLDALDRRGKDSPSRMAVGELTTKSPLLAKIWADMMALHGDLHGTSSALQGQKGVAAPPCTLREALSLTGRHRSRREDGLLDRPLLLSAPWQEAKASAKGYAPVARLRIGTTPYSLWTRALSAPDSPCGKGDFILYLPHTEPARLQAFLQEAGKEGLSLGIRPVAEHSLLLTLWELSPSVDLNADRLPVSTATPDLLPLDALCASPAVSADGGCEYLLRVSLKQVQPVTALLKRQDVAPIVIGQTTGKGSTVIRIRDSRSRLSTPVVDLPTSFLTSLSAVYLYAYEAEAASTSPAPPLSPAMARLPSPLYGEHGLTPGGWETVALTRYEGQILPIPEASAVVSARSAVIPPSHSQAALRITADTVAAATDVLADAGVSPDAMSLSVVLTVPSSEALTRGEVLAAICGIHHVAAVRSLPVVEPVINVDAAHGMTVTVAAYARDPELCATLSGRDDRQWHTPAHPVHKESPCFMLPALRRSYEDSLRAVAAALNRDQGAACFIHPVILDTVEEEVPVETSENSGETPATRKEIRYTLNPDAVAQLAQKLLEWNTPVFSMSEADARLLLSEPAVLDALTRMTDMGYPLIVLGEACKPFAEAGFLPTALAEVIRLPSAGIAAPVTYTLPADGATRLLRADVRVPAGLPEGEDMHHLTLRLPDGTAVPDGFVGKGGRVLGLLNGIDTTLIPFCTSVALKSNTNF